MTLLATRTGQILNKTDLAAPLGVSVPTIGQWLGVLEITQQVFLIPPYFENLGKRIIKSPKILFADTGLACHLLGIETEQDLEKSAFLGPLFEGFIASEIIKSQLNGGKRRELYYFRDQRGLEVDFIIPLSTTKVRLVEVKTTRTPKPEMARPSQRLLEAFHEKQPHPVQAESLLVHRQPKAPHQTIALAQGVSAIDWRDFAANPLGTQTGTRPNPKSKSKKRRSKS